jgi:hypothetical protein
MKMALISSILVLIKYVEKAESGTIFVTILGLSTITYFLLETLRTNLKSLCVSMKRLEANINGLENATQKKEIRND